MSSEAKSPSRKQRQSRGIGEPDPTKDRSSHDAARGRRVGKKGLTITSKRDVTDDEFRAALVELNKSPDRAAAISGGAIVDDALWKLLWAAMKRPENALFDNDGAPLKTFSFRIRMAWAFGLLDAQERDDLNRIRQIRNAFAHSLAPLSFDDSPIAEACRQMSAHTARDLGAWPADAVPRTCFETACRGLWLRLIKRATKRHDDKLASNGAPGASTALGMLARIGRPLGEA